MVSCLTISQHLCRWLTVKSIVPSELQYSIVKSPEWDCEEHREMFLTYCLSSMLLYSYFFEFLENKTQEYRFSRMPSYPFSLKKSIKMLKWPREVAQWYRVLNALPDDSGSISSTQCLTNICNCSLGDPTTSTCLNGHEKFLWGRHNAENTYTHKINFDSELYLSTFF